MFRCLDCELKANAVTTGIVIPENVSQFGRVYTVWNVHRLNVSGESRVCSACTYLHIYVSVWVEKYKRGRFCISQGLILAFIPGDCGFVCDDVTLSPSSDYLRDFITVSKRLPMYLMIASEYVMSSCFAMALSMVCAGSVNAM